MILLATLLAAAPVHQAGPPDMRDPRLRYDSCVKQVDIDPDAAAAAARTWAQTGGGIAAGQCLGMAETARSNWKSAADAFSAAATVAGQLHDERAADLWVSAGNAALAGNDPARARTALSNALAVPTMAPGLRGEAYLDRARASVAAGDTGGARIDLDQALTLVPGDPMAWLLSATLARRMGDLTRAASDIGEAKTRAPQEPAVLFEAGNIAAAGGDMDKARAEWTGAHVAGPDSDAGQAAARELAASASNGGAATPAPRPPRMEGR